MPSEKIIAKAINPKKWISQGEINRKPAMLSRIRCLLRRGAGAASAWPALVCTAMKTPSIDREIEGI
jgi:hypothetical protein